MADTTPTTPVRRSMVPGWAIILGVVIFIVIILGGCAISAKNKMVNYDEAANKTWADVQSAYQRRADLIPNLVSTVQGYADFEKSTLTQVIEARAKATSITIDPSKATAEQFQQFEQAQNQLSGALNRLLVTVEQYPDLKANQNFLELQSQLEGTENRINVSRNDYNESVRKYNTYIRGFPGSMFAGWFGFSSRQMFQAAPGSENAPKVDFGKQQ